VKARKGEGRKGKAWEVKAIQGKEWNDKPRKGNVRQGITWHVKARQGMAWKVNAWHGK